MREHFWIVLLVSISFSAFSQVIDIQRKDYFIKLKDLKIPQVQVFDRCNNKDTTKMYVYYQKISDSTMLQKIYSDDFTLEHIALFEFQKKDVVIKAKSSHFKIAQVDSMVTASITFNRTFSFIESKNNLFDYSTFQLNNELRYQDSLKLKFERYVFTDTSRSIIATGTYAFAYLVNEDSKIFHQKDSIEFWFTEGIGCSKMVSKGSSGYSLNYTSNIGLHLFDSLRNISVSSAELKRVVEIENREVERVIQHAKNKAELLNRFVNLEQGLLKSNQNNSSKGNYEFIEKNSKAKAIKIQADELHSIIENFKSDLIYKMTGGLDEDSIPVGKDNMDAGSHYFLVSNNGEKGKILEEKMDAYRMFLLSIVKDTTVANRIDKMLATDDTKEQKWIELLSSHLPLAAVTANLTLLQTFVRNAEAESIEYLVRELDKK